MHKAGVDVVRLSDLSKQKVRAELARRSCIVERALATLAKLKTKLISSSGVSPKSCLAASSTASSAATKLTMVYLLDEDALQALLDELEAALDQCGSSMEPDDFHQAVQTYRAAVAIQIDQRMALHQSLSDHSGASQKGM